MCFEYDSLVWKKINSAKLPTKNCILCGVTGLKHSWTDTEVKWIRPMKHCSNFKNRHLQAFQTRNFKKK
jgi:hypothetical protein